MLPHIEAFTGEEHQAFSLMGGKPAALLVHGFPGTANDLRGLAQALNAEGWTTHNLLLPGFGADIQQLPNYGFKDWLKTVKTGLDDLKRRHSPVLLVGHSMGGALSITAAAELGVDALLLLAPFYKINHILWSCVPALQFVLPQFKPFRVFKPDFQNSEFRDGVRKFMPSFDFENLAHQAAVREFAVPVRIFAHIREAGMKAYANAPKITAPTFVIQGRQDTLVMPENTRLLAQRLGGASQWLDVDGEHEINRTDLSSWAEVRSATLKFVADMLKGRP
jgi:esterase/lipase